ncbi:MAG: IS110 family transposase [Janthinobacterium lividum]
MEHYVALDVSLREISVCVMDGKGAVLFEGKTAADPAALVALIRAKAPHVVRIGLETGATSPWLFHALAAHGLPMVCMDARHAHAALSMRPTKSDRSDARGLADMLRMDWSPTRSTTHDAYTRPSATSAPCSSRFNMPSRRSKQQPDPVHPHRPPVE